MPLTSVVGRLYGTGREGRHPQFYNFVNIAAPKTTTTITIIIIIIRIIIITSSASAAAVECLPGDLEVRCSRQLCVYLVTCR